MSPIVGAGVVLGGGNVEKEVGQKKVVPDQEVRNRAADQQAVLRSVEGKNEVGKSNEKKAGVEN